MNTPLSTLFTEDAHGRRYADVFSDPHAPTKTMLKFFDDPDRQRQMAEAEGYDRPALFRVVREFEDLPAVSKFFATRKPHQTLRFRQAVGVAVRICMNSLGWSTTGRKGSVKAKWFTRSEHYQKASSNTER